MRRKSSKTVLPSPIDDIPEILNGEHESVSVESIKCHPKNVRKGNLAKITNSIRDNGFFGDCVVQRSTGHILVGNHRYMAARELGMPVVPIVWIECDDGRALRIMLADNKTSDDAENDETALAALLADLAKTDTGLDGTGFNNSELDDLISKLAKSNDQLSDIAGESTPSPKVTTQYLKFGDHIIPMTDQEFASLEARFLEHMGMASTSYGFVNALLDGE